MGRKSKNGRTPTPTETLEMKADTGFQPPQTLGDLGMMIKAMSAFYIKSGGTLDDLIPPRKISNAPTIEEKESEIKPAEAEKKEVLERKLTAEELAELAAKKEALHSHNRAIGNTNGDIRKSAVLQAALRGVHRHKSSPKFYEKLNGDWVAGDTKMVTSCIPTWLYDEAKKKSPEVGRMICALLAESVGIDLSRVECSRSKFIDSPAPADKEAAA